MLLKHNGKIIDDKGTICWYKDGILHREDGPAIEWFDGIKEWICNGKLHREDGPAIEYPSGKSIWYYKGNKIPVLNQQDYLKYIKLFYLHNY